MKREAERPDGWELYEIFIRARSGLDHKHVGSVHATDARMALEHARDVYTRRQEGISIWVVRSADILASDPAEADALFEPAPLRREQHQVALRGRPPLHFLDTLDDRLRPEDHARPAAKRPIVHLGVFAARPVADVV